MIGKGAGPGGSLVSAALLLLAAESDRRARSKVRVKIRSNNIDAVSSILVAGNCKKREGPQFTVYMMGTQSILLI